MRKSAVISECGKYRYSLKRIWGESLPLLVFVMLNPSTADAEQDDPTIRKCIGFAKLWGYGGIVVVNIYAYRATDPRELWKCFDPVGDKNNYHIQIECNGRDVVCAWGSDKAHQKRGRKVLSIIAAKRIDCIKTSAAGYPCHPLYLSHRLKRVEFAVGIADTRI